MNREKMLCWDEDQDDGALALESGISQGKARQYAGDTFPL